MVSFIRDALFNAQALSDAGYRAITTTGAGRSAAIQTVLNYLFSDNDVNPGLAQNFGPSKFLKVSPFHVGAVTLTIFLSAAVFAPDVGASRFKTQIFTEGELQSNDIVCLLSSPAIRARREI
jgi:hypothetical protein